MDNKFKIIVTQYNADKYIRKCLESIRSQTYKNYDVIVVDDCSTDLTLPIAQQYPVYTIRNAVRTQLAYPNFSKGINLHPNSKEDIMVLLSGDDYFSDDEVLSVLNDAYQENIWMTYGTFIPLSGNYGAYGATIPDTRTYRRSGAWVTSHLVTFKKWLWDCIHEEDFKYKGEYSKYSFDRAFMYPMIEMAGKDHIKFIERVTYVYNDMNPACIYKIKPKESIEEAKYFMGKQSYDEL